MNLQNECVIIKQKLVNDFNCAFMVAMNTIDLEELDSIHSNIFSMISINGDIHLVPEKEFNRISQDLKPD